MKTRCDFVHPSAHAETLPTLPVRPWHSEPLGASRRPECCAVAVGCTCTGPKQIRFKGRGYGPPSHQTAARMSGHARSSFLAMPTPTSSPQLAIRSFGSRIRFALMRLFARHIGSPQHTYMTHVRLRVARQLLLKGEPAAAAAAAVGYVDQSHLTKRFRAAFGVTPGQFAAALA